MARIVCITHEFDTFVSLDRATGRIDSIYMLFDILEVLKAKGHSWQLAIGPRPVPGDVGILHVNCTRVSHDYLSLGSYFRKTINFGTADISKRRTSGAVLARGEAWEGPVIIKSDFNYMGYPEAEHNQVAAWRGQAPPHPGVVPLAEYVVLPSLAELPGEVWNDPHKVVERFVPERDPDGYALRTWVFAGNRERCTRHVSRDPIVKAANIVSRRPSEVPPLIRAERERLGFDYGKFDFVVHDGQPILLDANRTPSSSPGLRAFLQAGTENLAHGLGALIAVAF